ncbi:asparagine synthase (glutamine-hydrolyzing) [Bosea sp. 47.2.35]|uniref:asparagine synthase (glutamine-hydrolyzing) n=2 Tax=Boseaceae TaxID=2831100 RepID=UPI00286B3887|nr:asparagine synthase (glutamine-hydrolyzing) [Bosea sp. BE271]MCR4523805.1 asparagine synthase (glutamine-hydrolyzing) [Bosea sp. 47.2.35]
MCGLFGSIGFAPDMARIDLVSHRGPDGRGWREFASPGGPVALGHRRLAIIDVSDAGLQPMSERSGRYHLVFNGEIYNYIELRDEMRASGEIFETESDSEVLLRAYMLWGEGALKRLRGMFAFLIWDDRDKTLFAARDRYGIKPLYIAASGQGVAFASEIKQLLDLAGGTRRLNLARAYDFLADGMSDHTAETLFEGILQIRGGEYAIVAAHAAALGQPIVRRWHEVAMPPVVTMSEKDAAERFRELLRDSVRLHLRADVPVGSCLSGGLDSSSIVCLMARMLPADGLGLHTVSACYADKSVDEKPFMDAVIEATGAQAHFVFPRAEDVFQRVADITWHQDEPFGSSSIFAQWCVFETAKAACIKVMLDGQGADEILAGYHGLFPTYLAELARSMRLMQLARTMAERRSMHGQGVGRQAAGLIYSLAPDGMKRLVRGARHDHLQHGWLSTDTLASLEHRPSALETAAASLGLKAPGDIASICLVMAHSSNLPMLLHWEDRNSMAHGIEARVPFLDHPLVDFALGLGSQHKLVGADTKRVLRRAMADVLPPAVSARRDKLGFATPEAAWFRGPLRQLVEDGVERTLRTLPGLLDPAGTRRFASKMLSGAAPLDFSLWRIISLGIWAERFKVSLG